MNEKMPHEEHPEQYDIHKMQVNGFYKQKDVPDESAALLYIMGVLPAHDQKPHLICEVYRWDLHRLSFNSMIQGIPAIKLEEWEQITQEKYTESRQKLENQWAKARESADMFNGRRRF